LRTRVETTVAMEFAASWKPFMKSKTSAMTTSATTTQMLMERLSTYEFSRTMPSMMFATSSQRSLIVSSSS